MKNIYLKVEECKKNVLQIKVAATFLTRLRGLLGTAKLPDNEGLLISPCNSVHMLGMRYALDIIYLDKANKIIKIVPLLKPWQFSMCWAAENVLEINAGMAKRFKLEIGKQLNFSELS